MAVIDYTEVETSLGRILTPAEEAQVMQWLDDAELLIGARLGDVALLDQDVLAFVVREAVVARVRNPDPSLEYEAIDDYRYGRTKDSRRVTILDEWWELLAPTSTSSAFTIQPGSHDLDRVSLLDLDWS